MTDDLIDLVEWNRFAEQGMTLLEALTILNNRHRAEVYSLKAEIERFKANNRYQRGYHDGEKSEAIKTDAMREKLWKAEEAFQKIIRSVPCFHEGFWFWPNISPDGDYLGEIQTDPASSMQEMQAIAETALAKLQNTNTP